jgi:hypothetical protein
MQLNVTILGARGLRSGDWISTSNPYCTCEVSGKPHTKFKTESCNRTREPRWNFSHSVSDFTPGESLSFTVVDEGLMGHDVLGRTVLHGQQFANGYFQGELVLTDHHHGTSYLSVRVEPAGFGCLGGGMPSGGMGMPMMPGSPGGLGAPMMPSGGGCALKIRVVSAENLRRADLLPGRSSDPYVTVEVVGKPHSRFKTNTIDNNLSPVWNFEHVCRDFSPGDALIFQVYDEDTLKSDDFLGKVTLQSSQFYPQGFSGSVPLEENDGHNSRLTLAVEVGPPSGSITSMGSWVLPSPATPSSSSRDITSESTGCARPLDVTIFSARGLSVKSSRKPYCVCRIEGGAAKKVNHREFQTHSVDSSPEPVWNFTHTLAEYRQGCDLVFTVKDEQMMVGHTIGKTTLAYSRFYTTGFQGLLTLADSQGTDAGVIAVKVVPATAENQLHGSVVGMNMLQQGQVEDPLQRSTGSVPLPPAMPVAAYQQPMGGPMGGPMSGPMGGVVYAGPDGQPMQQFVPAQDKTLPPAPAGPSGALAPGAGAPRAQPQPQTLHTSVHSENQRIKWTVDARKLRGGDKQAVSQAFPISWGGLQVNFKLMIYPKMMHDQRGGSSFKKAKGKGTITLKCEAELPQGTPPLKFRFAIAQGLNAHKSEDPDQDDLVGLQDYRGPVRHNFADGAMCGLPKDLEEWDFNAVVDHDSQTFLVCLEVVGESS